MKISDFSSGPTTGKVHTDKKWGKWCELVMSLRMFISHQVDLQTCVGSAGPESECEETNAGRRRTERKTKNEEKREIRGNGIQGRWNGQRWKRIQHKPRLCEPNTKISAAATLRISFFSYLYNITTYFTPFSSSLLVFGA